MASAIRQFRGSDAEQSGHLSTRTARPDCSEWHIAPRGLRPIGRQPFRPRPQPLTTSTTTSTTTVGRRLAETAGTATSGCDATFPCVDNLRSNEFN